MFNVVITSLHPVHDDVTDVQETTLVLLLVELLLTVGRGERVVVVVVGTVRYNYKSIKNKDNIKTTTTTYTRT